MPPSDRAPKSKDRTRLARVRSRGEDRSMFLRNHRAGTEREREKTSAARRTRTAVKRGGLRFTKRAGSASSRVRLGDPDEVMGIDRLRDVAVEFRADPPLVVAGHGVS